MKITPGPYNKNIHFHCCHHNSNDCQISIDISDKGIVYFFWIPQNAESPRTSFLDPETYLPFEVFNCVVCHLPLLTKKDADLAATLLKFSGDAALVIETMFLNEK